MKKHLLIIITIILIAIIIVCYNIIQIQGRQNELKNYNLAYENYLNKEIYGSDVATVMNKALDSNKKNNIQKDEKGYFIDNGQDSVQIELIMITDEEKQETTTYKMETIEQVGMTSFLSNFSLTTFKSSNVKYHKDTGKIAKITFEQLESISY